MLLDEATRLFKTLGDSNRVRIVHLLMGSEMCATEILEQLEISQPTLSHHMKLLTDADLVKSRREHTMTFYSLNKEYVNDVCTYISAMAPDAVNENEIDKKSQCVAEQLEFLMQVSHRLRTEINGIKGMAHMIEKSDDRSQTVDYAHKILEASAKLEKMVNEIVDKSELELDADILLFESFNVYDTARELNSIYASMAEKVGIGYKSIALGVINHPNITCSRIYVKKLWQIILDSIIRNGKKGGTLTITFQEHCASQNVTNHRVSIETTNMPLCLGEDEDTIRTMVQKLRGTLQLDDKLVIDFPLQIDKRTEAELAKSSGLGTAGIRVLLIEDDELDTEVAEYVLKEAGVIPIIAHSCANAIDVITSSAEGELDLVLVDIDMPCGSALDAVRTIRSMDRSDTANLPIIAMSTSAFVKDIMAALDAGMNDHVAKPLDSSKLSILISQWLA